MAAIVPAWGFTNHTSLATQTSSPPDPFIGSQVNTHATVAHSDGVATTLLTAVDHDVHFLIIGYCGSSVATVDWNSLVDILYDPAGGTSWTELIPDLGCGQHYNNGDLMGSSYTQHYMFPLWVPAGSSFGARLRSPRTNDFQRIKLDVYGEPTRPDMWWCGSGVEVLGAVPASSTGTAVSPGVSSAYGSWTDIGISTHPYGAVQFGLSGMDNNMITQAHYYQLGYGSTRFPGAQELYVAAYQNETIARHTARTPFWCDVPSGTTWQIRGMCSTGTAESAFMLVHGVY